jgi:hypothetical protein
MGALPFELYAPLQNAVANIHHGGQVAGLGSRTRKAYRRVVTAIIAAHAVLVAEAAQGKIPGRSLADLKATQAAVEEIEEAEERVDAGATRK